MNWDSARLVSVSVKGDYMTVLEVFEPGKQSGFSLSDSDGYQVCSIVVAARTMKDLEHNVDLVKKVFDHEGLKVR